jgi:hypothetical protein
MLTSYTPTVYVNDSLPAINAANLNKAENKLQEAVAELRRLAGDPALPNTAIALDAALRVGDWTVLGADGAFDTNLDWMIGYVGAGLYYDGTNWQCPGGAHGNGWMVIGVHADGNAYIYKDATTGTGSRSYTRAQFLAKRGASLGAAAAPSTLQQEGAANGDVITWNSGSAKYVPAAPTVPNVPVVASTVGGLGAGVDGKMGLLRLGSTPFEFTRVHYDATYGKWITEAEIATVLTLDTATALSTSTTFVDIKANGSITACMGAIAWRVRDSAGLLPQCRMIMPSKVASGTGTFQPSYWSSDTGSTSTTNVAITTGAVTLTSTSVLIVDSGWQPIPGGYAVKDWIAFGFQSKNSGAGNTFVGGKGDLGISPTVRARWVG